MQTSSGPHPSDSKIHVLHLRASNFVGGPERQILRYLHADANADITIGTFVGDHEGRDFARAVVDGGGQLLSLPAGSFRALSKLVRYLRERPVRLICTHGYKADVLGIAAGAITHTPVAAFLRGWTGENRRVRLYETLDRRLSLPRAQRIVCLSDVQRREALNYVESERVQLVTNAIETFESKRKADSRISLRRRFAFPENCVVVACAGRLSPEKGTRKFIEAAALVVSQCNNVRFLIFGDGPLRTELETHAQNLRLREIVHFAGFLQEFPALLGAVDIFVNPSLTEAMPNVVLEAMASGVPVIATDVGSVAEIGSDGAMVVVPARNAESIAHAILQLVSDPQTASQLGEAGRNRVAERYSLRAQQEQLRTLYAQFAAH